MNPLREAMSTGMNEMPKIRGIGSGGVCKMAIMDYSIS